MAFTSHIFLWSRLWGKGVSAAVAVAAVLLTGTFFRSDRDRSAASGVMPVEASLEWREAPVAVSPDFSVMQGSVVVAGADAAAFLAAFRFAGTFFLYGAEGQDAELRRGVLSYLPENRQEIVSEGSVIGGVCVKSLYEDRIVLEKDGQEGTLLLGGGAGGQDPSLLLAEPDVAVGKFNRFGEQTGEGVWTLDKSSLMAYYEELLDQPERLLQVFDSMHPLYAADGKSIEGYTLQPVGEKAFFEAVGFHEGDIVRKVNALPMTNRGRAEFFIKQVVQDRLSAIVIDIEREGGSKRLVYQLR